VASESTEHLLKVINDILDFSRIERAAWSWSTSTSTWRPDHQQRPVVPAQRPAARPGLHLQCPPAWQLQVQGDPTRIRQILVNLIGNALKFTERGGQVEARWQVLDRQLMWLTCTVRDSGIGIDSDRLEMMFIAFQQADSSISGVTAAPAWGCRSPAPWPNAWAATCAAKRRRPGLVFTLEMPLALATPAPVPLTPPASAQRWCRQ
jgi:signal transduction histidine kinase